MGGITRALPDARIFCPFGAFLGSERKGLIIAFCHNWYCDSIERYIFSDCFGFCGRFTFERKVPI
jgi:hypothetical protein